ncbi:MAG: hypothetical protein JW874_14985 [Spirochaetales bacterium]|nr:hypothetical protein [Spirochaetales bacterium]
MNYSEEDARLFQSHYRLFLDLDGVLSDFDGRVYELFGRFPDKILPHVMWSKLASTKGFFSHLDWKEDSRELWYSLKIFNPVVLTGIPRGNWAITQKQEWCARELGCDVRVITCFARQKPEKAREICTDTIMPVLIDDRDKIRDAWEKINGIFIHHRRTDESLYHFDKLVRTARAIPQTDRRDTEKT